MGIYDELSSCNLLDLAEAEVYACWKELYGVEPEDVETDSEQAEQIAAAKGSEAL